MISLFLQKKVSTNCYKSFEFSIAFIPFVTNFVLKNTKNNLDRSCFSVLYNNLEQNNEQKTVALNS